MQETQKRWVRSLGWEDPLEAEKATHSSILALGNPMDRGAWRATVHGVAQSRTQLKQQQQLTPEIREASRGDKEAPSDILLLTLRFSLR